MKTKYFLFAVDDTRFWNLPDIPETAKIKSVYLFDSTQHTFCCEITPSFECHKVYSTLEVSDIDDQTYELLYEMILENDNAGDVEYFHCRDIENLPRVDLENNFDDIDEAVEFARCNHYL